MNITYTQNGDYLIPNIVIRKKHHYPQDQAPRTLRQTSQGVSGNAPSDTVQ